VIDVLSAATAHRAVERPVIVKREKVDHAPLLLAAAPGLYPADAFAGVLDHLAARRDALGGIDAPPVNLRGLDFQPETRIGLIDGRSWFGLAPGHFTQL
jgi:hypothetical protein